MSAVKLVPPVLPPVRYSHLKHMARSPAHYLGAVVAKSPNIEKGTAVHSLVLGGKRIIAYPGKVRNGGEWEAFKAANADAEILTKNDFEKAKAMADSVKSNRTAMKVLEGRHELEVDWTYMGRACQSHIDNVGADFVTELKSGMTSDPARFFWHSLRMHYAGQVAFYDEACRAKKLCDPKAHYIVCVEAAAPFVTTTFQLTERALEQGRRSFRLWFERLLACEAAGSWPGYCESVVDLDVPEEEPELTFGDEAAA